jgi:hypothetical protein
MGKSIRDNTKKLETRGRKRTTGPGELIGVRLQSEQLSALDGWIVSQNDAALSRPEAIRQLVAAMLQILAKDPGEKPARKPRNK